MKIETSCFSKTLKGEVRLFVDKTVCHLFLKMAFSLHHDSLINVYLSDLSVMYNKKVVTAKLLSVDELQAPQSQLVPVYSHSAFAV